MKRAWLLAGVAAALVVGQPVEAKKRPPPPPQHRLDSSDSPVDPFYGKINPFYGNINPFYGKINPFYGTISPFWGNIQPFWGKINPFMAPDSSTFTGANDIFWGNISPFTVKPNPFYQTVGSYWQAAGPQWGAINGEWGRVQDMGGTDYSDVAAQMQSFVNDTAAFWDGQVTKYTKHNFMDGFGTQLLAQYGIDLGNPASLASVDAATRSQFFLAFYDGLMSFTGVDHVDWWMAAVHWSPSLTQTQYPAGPLNVGILDSTPDHDGTSVAHLQLVGGYNTFVNGHGEAVASLIAAQHDGKDVMGIAPLANVQLYNPFDASGTASWDDVTTGINTLYAKNAHVINMSLGVPGTVISQEWASIMQGLNMNMNNVVFVKAAGNEGVMQADNVMWNLLNGPKNLIMVGSVGPTGDISSFSNTPGEACFTVVLGICTEENKLKYRYLVAPGELILVSDNNGGVTRESGTSFAAPLVTGAVALLQARWPWLQKHSAETVQIVLQSADDLGDPGVDPVYGWGELDIEASQSPLSFDNLVIYTPAMNGKDGITWKTPLLGGQWSAQQLQAAILNPGQLDLWNSQKAFLVAFENIGSTYRDFEIPLTSVLVGKRMRINNEQNLPFQSYLYQRMIDWASGAGFSDMNAQSAALTDGDWSLSMTATASTDDEVRRGAGPFHSEFVATNRVSGVTLRLGEGNGARALTGQSGFSFASDFDTGMGGVNPVLGFASGGAYARGEFTFGDLHLNVGFSQKSDDHTFLGGISGVVQDEPFAPYNAYASVVGVDYAVADSITLNATYTHLNEATGLLGGQGRGPLSLSGGAATDSATVGATAHLFDGIELTASATIARTGATQFEHSALSLSGAGIESTAYEIAAAKRELFAGGDMLRLSVTQPLHIESGSLRYTSLQVVDRETGELGPLTQTWSLGGNREYRAEALYGLPIMDGRGEVAGFAMLDLNPATAPGSAMAYSVGAQMKFSF